MPTPGRSVGVDAGGPELEESAPEALRRVLLNALALLGAYGLPRAFTFAAAVVAARVLGVATFGAYGTAAAVAVILSVLGTLGMMQLLVREIAREPDRAPEWVAAAHLAKLGSVALMMGLLWLLVAGPLELPRDVQAAALVLGVGYAVGAYVENLGAYFQGVERMGVWMEAQALSGFVTGTSGIGLAVATHSLLWFCVSFPLGQLTAVGWLLIRAPSSVQRAWTAPFGTVIRLVRSLLPFAAAFVVLTAYYKVDILLLERWRGEVEAGLYAAAYKFVDVAHALALVAVTALYPRLSRMAARFEGSAGAKRRGTATRTAELLLLAAVPAAAALWLVRAPLVDLLYGGEYEGSAAVLALHGPLLPALALNMLGTFVLAARERAGTVAALYSGALVTMLALDWWLIPALGARGAALAMLCSELALAAAMLAALGRDARARPTRRVWAGVGVVTAGAALLSMALPPLGAAAACLALTVVAYTVAGVVPRREWQVLWEAVRR